MSKKYLYILILLTLVLIGLVVWGFDIRMLMTPEYNYSYPLIFIGVFIMQTFFANKLIKGNRILNGFQPLGILLFMWLSLYSLYSISSTNRKNEIENYFAANENVLNNLAKHYMQFGEDELVSEMKHALKIERLWCKEDIFQVRLYTFAGYGYGVLYSENSAMEKPANSLGGSPIKKWLKLKDHWFYYSIFD